MFAKSVFASSLTFELGRINSQYNYFQKPNKDSNRVDLPDQNLIGGRIFARLALSERWDLSLLYAPLSTEYNFTSRRGFTFDGETFTQGQRIRVDYKFNSYRLGFLRKYQTGGWRFVLGPVLKVRDARLAVRQGNTRACFSNVGPVPLLGFGASYQFSEAWSWRVYADALAGGPGYAYDANTELRYHTGTIGTLGFGYRTLGGGADNDKLKNFARFNSWTLAYTVGVD